MNSTNKECARWPRPIKEIIEYYYSISPLSDNQRKEMVLKLQNAYEDLPIMERVDVLVPADSEFLKPDCFKLVPLQNAKGDNNPNAIAFLDFKYKWKNGFSGEPHDAELKNGQLVDRIGGKDGSYLCLVPTERRPYTKYERSLPYYIPEKSIESSPSYHRYVIIDVNAESLKDAQIGEIAPMFWCRYNIASGGGQQIKISRNVDTLINTKAIRKERKG